jgi:hypothetical protein
MAANTAMIAITTSISMSENPPRVGRLWWSDLEKKFRVTAMGSGRNSS